MGYVLTLHELVSIPCHFGIEVGTFLAGNVDMHVCAAGGMQCLCVCVLVNLVRKIFQAGQLHFLQIFIINECMDASVPDTIV